ncbi:MAG: TMEM199/VMA12 family vacuolar ATPase assembly factor [Clostridiales bacterium]|nr:TMEM199/VMA12 family vacuolar ATPase assembly factor [Clostridiales bacterium]
MIGFGVIIFAIVFELSGSSIGMWQSWVSDPSITDTGIIFGQTRSIRSDEWAVFTPMSLSQYYDGFAVFGNIFRGTTTDMSVIYGQPVMEWSIIFRPFLIGYLFLSPARGMAFWWAGKLVFLVLVSFEFGMLITERRKLLSLVYALMMAFAPVVQWWFGTNSFPEMLIYGQGVVLCVAAYMRTEKYWKRILCALGFVWAGGAYLLVLYPAWQIPFFWVFFIAVVWVLIDNWRTFRFNPKRDIPIIIGCILLLIACMMFIVLRSWDTIQAIMGSVYPGVRSESGSGGFDNLFRYVGNLFLPINANLSSLNQTELSDWFNLFPLGIILSLWVVLKDKVKGKLIILLWVVGAILGSYCIVGFPSWLAKITLLNNSQTARAMIAVGFVNVLLLIRSFALRKTGVRVLVSLPIALILACVVVYAGKLLVYGEYLNKVYFLISVVMLTALFALALCRGRRVYIAFCILMCMAMIFEGGMVNPLRSGTDVIDENRLSQAIREIQEEESGIWIADENWVYGNFAAMNGAPTINSTNTYYNKELWGILDPDGEYEDIYNRYAHITINLVETETQIILAGTDVVMLNLSIDDLDLLSVDYIISSNALEQVESEDCTFTLIWSADDMAKKIYKVNYKE